MNDETCRAALAKLLFPDIERTPSGGNTDWFERRYPPRDLPEGAAVTRLGPSPTGFIHLGNLYTAFMNEKLARETGGVCFLRIEDTDRKREVAGAAEALIASLRSFGVNFDEGVSFDAQTRTSSEIGDYGPYHQSQRKDIYHAYVRRLVLEGKAYPCFLTEEELTEIREKQEARKENPGIYGDWARYRNVDVDSCRRKMDAGMSYVIRLHADAIRGTMAEASPITLKDGVRGTLTMPENVMDVVLLKSDGIPTYHFAHAIDDHLMRTTHVIRGEEWLSSLPIHAMLFQALGFAPPIYCHTTVLMKMEGETKRKLSKRKDPELSLDYYRGEGYHPRAILEYLLTVINSNFEEWRTAHPEASIDEFEMRTEKMSVSGILFDLEKLRDVSKDVLVRIPAGELADFLLAWAQDHRPEAYPLMAEDREKLARILDIGRDGAKPRKDLAYAAQIFDFIRYFFDPLFEMEDCWPNPAQMEDLAPLLTDYLEDFSIDDDREVWFEKIRKLGAARGYAAKPKDFKKEPEKYRGHVGDVSAAIRLAIVGRLSSPDLYEIQQILGADTVTMRLRCAIEALEDSASGAEG